jgi:hypothetical protein
MRQIDYILRIPIHWLMGVHIGLGFRGGEDLVTAKRKAWWVGALSVFYVVFNFVYALPFRVNFLCYE